MSELEIPFLEKLRKEFRQVAILTTPAPAGRRRVRRAWRLVPVLILVFAGAAAAATLLTQPTPTALVAQGLACTVGTNNNARSSVQDVEQRGATPVAACSKVLGIPATRLVACYDRRFGVVVYESDGLRQQCTRLQMRPLPAGYAAATARVYRLQQALNRLYTSADCISPSGLAAGAQRLLDKFGFVGWHTQVQLARGSDSQGPCGQFPAGGNSSSDAAYALEGRRSALAIDNGASRSVNRDVQSATLRLMPATGHKCFTTPDLERRVLRTFTAERLPVRFAVTREPRGIGFGFGRQARYEAGCTILTGLLPASDGRTILTWLNNTSGSPLPTSGPGMPSISDYTPVKG